MADDGLGPTLGKDEVAGSIPVSSTTYLGLSLQPASFCQQFLYSLLCPWDEGKRQRRWRSRVRSDTKIATTKPGEAVRA